MADYRKVDIEHELRRELEEARAELEEARAEIEKLRASAPEPVVSKTKGELRRKVEEARSEVAKLKRELEEARTIRAKGLAYAVPACMLAAGLILMMAGFAQIKSAERAVAAQEAALQQAKVQLNRQRESTNFSDVPNVKVRVVPTGD
jgi:DNA repair exonuclease SbcCD ATPase subunit